jgi:hypothetical protein
MRALTLVLFFFLVISVCSNYSNAQQQMQGNVFVVTTFERAFPENGSMAELDSLTHLYQINVWDRNPLVVSHKTVAHWWGHNNRDFVEITEVKTWEDIPKAMQKNNELFREVWPSKEARESYNKAYNKYFTGQHSDEIYREVK